MPLHFDIGSRKDRDRIGELLAPRGPWGQWGETMSSSDNAKHGGMLSLTLVHRNVPDRRSGWVQCKIEPSKKISGGNTGIFMEINDHFDLDTGMISDASESVEVLRNNFDRSMSNSEAIIDQIMSLR